MHSELVSGLPDYEITQLEREKGRIQILARQQRGVLARLWRDKLKEQEKIRSHRAARELGNEAVCAGCWRVVSGNVSCGRHVPQLFHEHFFSRRLGYTTIVRS